MASFYRWEQIASILLLIAISHCCRAQSVFLPLNRDYTALFAMNPDLVVSGFHSSIQPYLKSEVNAHVDLDSILLASTPDYMKFSKGEPPHGAEGSSWDFYPVFQVGYGHDMVSGNGYSMTGLGLSSTLKIKKKFALVGTFNTANRGFVNYVDSFIQGNEVVPGFGYAHPTKEGFAYSTFEGYMSYSPSQYFNFQLGQGKNFFGHGYRSLLLSDVAYNYPFLKISTSIWKIKYVNLFTAMNDVLGSGGNESNYQRKYASFHYLSWNATKWLNIGLFESVVWSGTDSSGVRGYDVNYLNPIMFYRPAEFSVGSPDHVIIGFNLAARIGKSFQLYGQVVIDEFLLAHIRAQDGWWANKQGFQLGLKAWNFFKVEGLSWLLEYNRVRPYTYSHGVRIQSYSHFNQPLAHPLGANFYETTTFLTYKTGLITIEGSFMYAVQGADSSGSNWGGNVFLPYDTYEREFDNVIGQGVNTTIMSGGIRAAYLIYPSTGLMLEVGINVRSNTSAFNSANSTLFTIGIRSNLGNTYHDF